jgi:hypothetical protein
MKQMSSPFLMDDPEAMLKERDGREKEQYQEVPRW